MTKTLRLFTRRLLTATVFMEIFVPIVGNSHDWPVHVQITASAYQWSAGLQTFLNENQVSGMLSANQPQCPASLTASNWLTMGVKMEDEQDYGHPEERTMEHFYTVGPLRTVGHVNGLTDGTEHPWWDFWNGLPGGLTNSFVWATQSPFTGPLGVGLNYYQWTAARQYEFAALTNGYKSVRNTNMAMMFTAIPQDLEKSWNVMCSPATRQG